MKWLLLVALFLVPRFAEAACPPDIEMDEQVRARWPELKDRVQSVLGSRQDVDRCARVSIALRAGARIHIEVTLADGRMAARDVPHREDVVPMLEALLLVPHPPAPEPPPPEPIPTVVAPSLTFTRTTRIPVDHAPPTADDEHVRIELSALSGARVGDGQAAIGFGALSFLEVSGWLAGVEGRIDRYWTSESHGAVLELALLAGRRFRFRNLALDITAGPGVVALGSGDVRIREVQPATPMPPRERESNTTVERLLVGTRLHFNARSTFRTFVGIDGEFGPEAPSGRDVPAEAYHLPTWTVGVALGATVGTR
jgi:hypothetical protein